MHETKTDKKKRVVLMLTHVWNEVAISRFNHLIATADSEFDCRILLDTSKAETRENCKSQLGEDDFRKYVFEFQAHGLAKTLGYALYNPGDIVPGSAHYPTLAYGKTNRYDEYWVVEYDVLIKMGWSKFSNLFAHSNADLLCTHLAERRHSSYWVWWDQSKFPIRYFWKMFRNKQSLRKGFFPIYRISRAGLEAVDSLHRKGMRAHQELALPTAVWLQGLSVQDMNAVAPTYSPGSLAEGEGDMPLSCFRWRPVLDASEIDATNQIIFHPSK